MTSRAIVGAVMSAVLAVLTLIVVLGIATGTDRHFDKGTVSTPVVVLVVGLGLACMATLVAALVHTTRFARGRPAHAGVWFVAGLVFWVVWAFVRVGEYAS